MLRFVTTLLMMLLLAAGADAARFGSDASSRGADRVLASLAGQRRPPIVQLCAALTPRREKADTGRSRGKPSASRDRRRGAPLKEAAPSDDGSEEQQMNNDSLSAGCIGACVSGACSVYHS